MTAISALPPASSAASTRWASLRHHYSGAASVLHHAAWAHRAPCRSLFPVQYSAESTVNKSELSPSVSATGGSSDAVSEKRPSGFDLQTGKAIDALRRELPFYFECGLADFSIYDEQIVLAEPDIYQFYSRGKRLYRCATALGRWLVNVFFVDASLSIQSVGRPAPDQLHIRWRMEGTSKAAILRQSLASLTGVSWSLAPPSVNVDRDDSASKSESSSKARPSRVPSTASPPEGYVAKSVYEGLSVYRFHPQTGLIVQHTIQNVIPAPKKFAPLQAFSWWQRARFAVAD